MFARLLGISSCDGGLFHKQGNFPTHGFVELTPNDIAERYGIDWINEHQDIDYDRVRLLTHSERIFRRGVDEDSLSSLKWKSTVE